jgi:hypothetical protein
MYSVHHKSHEYRTRPTPRVSCSTFQVLFSSAVVPEGVCPFWKFDTQEQQSGRGAGASSDQDSFFTHGVSVRTAMQVAGRVGVTYGLCRDDGVELPDIVYTMETHPCQAP